MTSRWRERLRGLGIVVDFHTYEQLAALRLPVPLRLFQCLIVGGVLLGVPMVLAIALTIGKLVAALVAEQGDAAYAVTVLAYAANLYVGGGYILREAFSARRFTVSNSPNVHFFRALDIRASSVFVVYCGLRTTIFYALLMAVDIAYVLVFEEAVGGLAAFALLLLPVSMYVVTLAVAVRAAARRRRPEPLGWPALGALGTGAVVVGYSTARFLVGPVRATGIAASFSLRQVETLAAVIVGVAALVTVLVGFRLILDARRLVRSGFVWQDASGLRDGRPRITRARSWASGVLPLTTILHGEFTRSSAYILVRRTFGVVLALFLAALGALFADVGMFPVTGLPDRFFLITHSMIFVTLLGVADIVLHTVGPTTFAAQFRSAWENQLPQLRLVGDAATYYQLSVLSLAAVLAALLWVVVGWSFVGPMSVGVSVMSAALIAESVTTAPRNVDGSTAANTVGGLLALMVAAPVLLALSLHSAVGSLLAAAYGVCLLGGAIACMARRLRTLPSRSAV